MQIIKDKQLTDSTWQFVTNDVLPEGDICLPLDKWREWAQQLQKHPGQLGVRLSPADNVAELAGDIEKLALVELDFPDFADGRLFSIAWLLRSRYGFKGEIRAVGHFMPDQVFYLSRVGVNAFVPAKPEHTAMILAHFDDFSERYQGSVN